MTEPSALPSRLRSPRFWVLTIATWAMVALTFSLGRWQQGRADYKQALAAQLQARQAEPALDNRALLKSGDLALDLHRSVRLQGRWLAERTIYLDNRPMQGRAGFWVYTPLLLEGSSRAILVQRGTDLLLSEAPRGPGLSRLANIKSCSKSLLALLLGTALDRGEIPALSARLSDIAPDLLPPDATEGAADDWTDQAEQRVWFLTSLLA